MPPDRRRLTIYIGTACACLLAPVLLSSIGKRPALDDVVTSYRVSVTLGVIALFGWELKRRLDSRAPVLGLLGAAFVAMVTYSGMTRSIKPPFDFGAYLRAAEAISDGTNPYVAQKGGYLYPPLLAESVYLLRRVVDEATSFAEKPFKNAAKKPAKQSGSPIFTLWCGLEIAAAVLVYALARRLAKRMGADDLLATGLPIGLLLANHAFWRSINGGQVNLLLTIVFLVASLSAAKRPLAAGFAVAFGTHLKIYPLFLLGAWTLSGRWKITAYALLCFGLIFALQISFFDPAIWENYFRFAARAPQQVRDASLATVSVISFTFGNGEPISLTEGSLVGYLTAIVYAGILLLMLARFVERELTWRKQHHNLQSSVLADAEDKFRIMGHANDAVVLPLLISPIVWNHHYVVLIPVLIWSTLALGPRRWLSWLPVAAILFPYFVRPYIYIYYAGVWLWLYQTSPKAIWAALAGIDEAPLARISGVSELRAPAA